MVVCIGQLRAAAAYEGRRYDQNGKYLQTIPSPQHCDHQRDLKLLEIQVAGRLHIAMPCPECQCIRLWSPDGDTWQMAWQVKAGRKEKQSPMDLCQGRRDSRGGQIIATMSKGYGTKYVTVFDIEQIPFKVIIPKMEIGIQPGNMCYSDFPGIGEAVAITSTFPTQYRFCLYSLVTKECLWTIGGQDKTAEPEDDYGGMPQYPSVIVGGARWSPRGVCTDNRGCLYVADINKSNPRILIFTVARGELLQQLSGPQWLGQPEFLSWSEHMASLTL